MIKIFTKLVSKPAIVTLVLLIIILLVAQLILANQLATSTSKLSEILSEVENFKRQNRDLAAQIYQKGSIVRLRELAVDAGFGEPKKFLFIRQSFLVAENLK